MLTVLSDIRKSNLYLIVAVISVTVVPLAFILVPSIAVPQPQPVLIPVTGVSEYTDYYQRHPELNVRAGTDRMRLHQNYPGVWVSRAAGVSILPTESLERPGMACESPVDCR